MSYPIKYPTPQGANIQIFNGGDPQSSGHAAERTWVKPQGASFVWFTLIGAGGGYNGANGFGGGSGGVTNFMCPAFLIPDSLNVTVGVGGPTNNDGTTSFVSYQQKAGTGYSLLTANGGVSGGIGGNAMTANYFTPMGFFQSVAGQDGASATVSASATTFLSGGGGGGLVTSNYGYSSITSGIFQMQPIIVGVGGGSSANGNGGVGCGGGGGTTGRGGDGMVVIITW